MTQSGVTSNKKKIAGSFLSKSDNADCTRHPLVVQPAPSVAVIPSPALFMIWCIIDTSTPHANTIIGGHECAYLNQCQSQNCSGT